MATEYWVDPAASEAGAAGTLANPYTRLDTALAVATGADCVIYLRRGRIYAPISTTTKGTLLVDGKTPATRLLITAYGPTDEMRPTMMAGTPLKAGTDDANWSHVSNGVWKRALAYVASGSTGRSTRLFANTYLTGPATNRSLGTGYHLGNGLARCGVTDSATEAEILAQMHTYASSSYRVWTYTQDSGGYLYCWTGSATVAPPTYYNNLMVCGSNLTSSGSGGWGQQNGISVRASSNIQIDNVDVLFGKLNVSGVTANTRDIKITNCNVYAYPTTSLWFVGSSSYSVTRASAFNCVSDAVGDLGEDWNIEDKDSTKQWINGGMDGCVIGAYTHDCSFDTVTSIDATHGCFSIGAQDSSTANSTYAPRIINCTAKAPNRLYSAAIGGNLAPGEICTIDRFHAEDVGYFCSRAGGGVFKFTHSIFNGTYAPYPAYTGYGDANTVPAFAVYDLSAPWGTTEAGAITLNKCTVLNPYGFVLQNQSATADAFNITESVIVDRTYLNDSNARRISASTAAPGVSIFVTPNTDPSITIATTNYYTGTTGGNIVRGHVATVGTNLPLASYPGIAGTVTEADPMVDENGFLDTSSPLERAATHTVYCRDATGRQRTNPPSRGAYDYFPKRASIL